MNKTIALQICLSLVAFYGLVNVILTELSGKGLCPWFYTRHQDDNDKILNPAAGSDAPNVIHLDVKRIPRERRNCFKYFTAQDGTWVETCIPSDDISKNNSKK